MRMDRLGWLLLGAGGMAAVAQLPLGLLLAQRGIDQGHDTDVAAALVFYAAGAFTVWRRPDHMAARRLLAVGTFLAAAIALGRWLSLITAVGGVPAWFWLANLLDQELELATFCTLLALFAVFPDGRYQRGYESLLVRASFLLTIPVPFLCLLNASVYINTNEVFVYRTVGSPFYTPSLMWLGSIALGVYSAAGLLVVPAIAVLAARYRRFGPERRQQIMWPLLAAISLAGAFVVALLGPDWAGVLLFNMTIMLLPLSLAVGILRYQLFDIEVAIRKSLAYGVLWLLIALVYVSTAALLGFAVGERFPVGLAILFTVTTTLAFQPARRWLEGLADRLVFGERLGEYELLRRFGMTLEEAFDIEELGSRVAAAIRQGLGVRWVRILVYGPDMELKPAGVDGIESHIAAEPSAAAPLLHGTEPIGRIECGPKVEGAFAVSDQELLETLGRQAALAIRNSHLTAELARRLDEIRLQAEELAASRSRIVRAQEAERRRIERNIHDGVQQELVALLAKLRLARNQLERGEARADATLAELQDEARQALDDLRELARGIHPPVLSDRGLVDALEARVARLPLGITIQSNNVPRGRRYAQEIEGAAYFLVCEGLANTMKHATARHAGVVLSDRDGRLEIEVTDDGVGFVPNGNSGSGLSGLRDRIEALGGSLQIMSCPGEGTTVLASLPSQERHGG